MTTTIVITNHGPRDILVDVVQRGNTAMTSRAFVHDTQSFLVHGMQDIRVREAQEDIKPTSMGSQEHDDAQVAALEDALAADVASEPPAETDYVG